MQLLSSYIHLTSVAELCVILFHGMLNILSRVSSQAETCRLLSLPVEIRSKIYKYIEQDSEVRVFGRNYGISSKDCSVYMLLVCRQVREEFGDFIYHNTVLQWNVKRRGRLPCSTFRPAQVLTTFFLTRVQTLKVQEKIMCREMILRLDCMPSLRLLEYDRGHCFGNEIIKQSILSENLEETLETRRAYGRDYFKVDLSVNERARLSHEQRRCETGIKHKMKEVLSKVKVQSKTLIVMREDSDRCKYCRRIDHPKCPCGGPWCSCNYHRTDGYDREVWARPWVGYPRITTASDS